MIFKKTTTVYSSTRRNRPLQICSQIAAKGSNLISPRPARRNTATPRVLQSGEYSRRHGDNPPGGWRTERGGRGGRASERACPRAAGSTASRIAGSTASRIKSRFSHAEVVEQRPIGKKWLKTSPPMSDKETLLNAQMGVLGFGGGDGTCRGISATTPSSWCLMASGGLPPPPTTQFLTIIAEVTEGGVAKMDAVRGLIKTDTR